MNRRHFLAAIPGLAFLGLKVKAPDPVLSISSLSDDCGITAWYEPLPSKYIVTSVTTTNGDGATWTDSWPTDGLALGDVITISGRFVRNPEP